MDKDIVHAFSMEGQKTLTKSKIS